MSSYSDPEGSETQTTQEGPSTVEEGDHGGQIQPVKGKGKKRKWKRGSTMTAAKRALQFPEVMEVRGESMWCIACECPVNFNEKCIASQHCRSEKHKANAKK